MHQAGEVCPECRAAEMEWRLGRWECPACRHVPAEAEEAAPVEPAAATASEPLAAPSPSAPRPAISDFTSYGSIRIDKEFIEGKRPAPKRSRLHEEKNVYFTITVMLWLLSVFASCVSTPGVYNLYLKQSVVQGLLRVAAVGIIVAGLWFVLYEPELVWKLIGLLAVLLVLGGWGYLYWAGPGALDMFELSADTRDHIGRLVRLLLIPKAIWDFWLLTIICRDIGVLRREGA